MIDKEVQPLSEEYKDVLKAFKEAVKGKICVVFGTGSSADNLWKTTKQLGVEISFFVDNNKQRQGKEYNNLLVCAPNRLWNEPKDKILIFIASMYYGEIGEQLDAMGFERNIHYFDGLKLLDFISTGMVLEEDFFSSYVQWEKEIQYESNGMINEVPCHYQRLFVKSDGSVYPCCRVWNRDDMRLGHINDPDLMDKLDSFSGKCRCGYIKFRGANESDKHDYLLLNLELSLVCQAKCAMCCVNAPAWKGEYDYYSSLEKLIDCTLPKELYVQGGEVLVQHKSLEWLKKIKHKHNSMNIILITNGNADICMVDTVEEIFGCMNVSFVGFQNETYKSIMGLNIDKTKTFVERVAANHKVEVGLKYLFTPLNLHEINEFLKWAVNVSHKNIIIADSNLNQYINRNTEDMFWNKIIHRTSQEFKRYVIENKHKLEGAGLNLRIDALSRQILRVDKKFITENGLENIIIKED